MLGDAPTHQKLLDGISEFVEVDPSGRYGRYPDVLGKGASKIVYKGFDELEGIEVAWNQVRLKDVVRSSDDLERFHSELHLLKTLKHKNIIKFYGSWVDAGHGNINFITEIFTSGNLRQYRLKHKHVDMRAVKNWARQILEGLLYLHSCDPPVIHRDLKCDNIFVNGSHGEVKIGDLGMAAILRNAHSAHTIIGTPEFMAPEFFKEDYNELVDIYAFGMCLLELVTFEYPYIECLNSAQIFRNITSGIKPASLAKVKDPEVKRFIEKCITNVSERLPARELLMDSFFGLEVLKHGINYSPQHYSDENSNIANGKVNFPDESSRDFVVEGQKKDVNKIFLKLRISDSTGQVRNIHFPFDVEVDTSISVATEMVEELDLLDQDVTTLAAMIDSEIKCHIPDWTVGTTSLDGYEVESAIGNVQYEVEDEVSAFPSDPPKGFVLERLSSGRRYWSDSPRGSPTLTQSGISYGCNYGSSAHGLAEVPEKQEPQSVNNNNQEDRHSNRRSSQNHPDPLHSVNGLEESLSTSFSQQGELSGTRSHNLPSNSESITENEGGLAKPILEKLEYLMANQKKELDDMKKKYDQAIAGILKDLPPELHSKILCKYRIKFSDGSL